MDERLAVAQSLRYAEEFRRLYAEERRQRGRAEEALALLQDSYRTTVHALAAALEMRDDQTGAHAERVTALGLRLTQRVAPDLLADPQLEYGFLIHDLGKIGVPDAIVLKPGALDPDEMEQMRRHTVLGERIVASIPHLNGVAREIAAAHHERWDGRGYPRGIRGAEIPLPARIFSVVDTFDAMTNDRPYRKALPSEAALEEILRVAGMQLDPQIARAFVALAPDLEAAA